MHDFLIIPTDTIPQWTKDNVPFYSLAPVSNDGKFLLMDNAHPISTYKKWLGAGFYMYESLMAASTVVTADEFKAISNDPLSVWYFPQADE